MIEDQDFIRAFIIVWVSPAYQPVELLRTFFETEMPNWENITPSWLTPEFRTLIDAWVDSHGA